MTEPLISVIIPTYNNAKFVVEAVESALAQTYKNIEIIVIDDGSTDNTATVVKEYIKSYVTSQTANEKIKYVYKENGGPASARNLGIKQARGEYIAFLDADDIWLPDKLQIQMEAMKEKGIYLIGCGRLNKAGADNKLQAIKYNQLLIKNYFSNSSVLLKRQCLGDSCFDERPEFRGVEDWDLWIRIAQHYPVGLISRRLVQIRQRAGSLSSTNNVARMLQNEIAVINKNIKQKRAAAKSRAYSYHFFAAAWAYRQNGDMKSAKEYLMKSIRTYPLIIMDRSRISFTFKFLLGN